MNTLRKILVGAGGAALLAGLGTAAHAADATANTSATIVRAIAITKNTDLAFGTFVRPATDGTISLSTAGVLTGAVSTPSSGARTAAQFTIAGEGGQTFSISEVATLGGPSTLALTLTKAATSGGTLSSTGSGGTGTLSGTLGDTADGTVVVKYGASFPITTTTATGAYSGTLVVTVDYN